MKVDNGFPQLLGNSTIWLCSTYAWEYEFDSLLEVTSEKDVDQVHKYENQLEIHEQSIFWLDESHPTSVDDFSINSIWIQRHFNIPSNKIILGLKLCVQAFDDYILNAIKNSTSLWLTYPKLID